MLTKIGQRRDLDRFYSYGLKCIVHDNKSSNDFDCNVLNISSKGVLLQSMSDCFGKSVVINLFESDVNKINTLKGFVVWKNKFENMFHYGINLSEDFPLDFIENILQKKSYINERRNTQKRVSGIEVKLNHRISDRRDNFEIFKNLKRIDVYKKLRDKNLFSYLREIDSASASEIIVNGKSLINFGSNNYLGLTTNKDVIKAGVEAAEKYGSGSGGVRVLSGTMSLHNQLEKRIASFKKMQECILFPTGYTANLTTLHTIARENSFIIIDEKAHASLIDGAKLSGANIISFKHNSAIDIEKKICKLPFKSQVMVVIDGVYSMDGDIACLDEIYFVCNKYCVPILVDDAHSTGVIGDHGRGTVSHFNLDGKIQLVSGTLSKSLGSIGGFVTGNAIMINRLKEFSRGFIFSTSLPPFVLGSSIKALEILENSTFLVDNLNKNISYIHSLLDDNYINYQNSRSAIIPIIIGDNELTYKITKDLEEYGLFVNPVTYPAVKKENLEFVLALWHNIKKKI